MKLLTKALIDKFKTSPIGAHDCEKRPKVIVKFFTPDSNWTWYATEGNPMPDGDFEFFGLVEGFESELGYFRLSELEAAKGPLGLRIERDRYFDGYFIDTESYPMKAVKVVKS